MRPDSSDIAERRMRKANTGAASGFRSFKQRNGKKFSFFVLILSLAFSFTLWTQNRKDIRQYINRPITKIHIDNRWQQISESEIRQMIAGYMHVGFFQFDVLGVKEALELHAWVEKVSVKRVWPDSLSLTLTERVAIARWGGGKLLDQHGEIFQPENAAKYTSLPFLAGPLDHQGKVMEQYRQINQLLFPSGLRLSGLTLSPRGSWELTLNDSIQVVVGIEKIPERLQRFVDFYESQPVEDTASISSVDLRYDNGMAIRKRLQEFSEVAIR